MRTANNQSDFCDATARGRGIQGLKQLFEAINLKLRGANPWHLFGVRRLDAAVALIKASSITKRRQAAALQDQKATIL